LGFDRRERRGTFVLVLLISVLIIVRLTAMRPGDVPEVLPPLPSSPEVTAGGNEEAKTAPVLFVFDPNTCTYDDLLRLGLSDRQARTLINYRNSGARFRRPEDLRRVYGIDSATASELIPYITIIAGTDPEQKPAVIHEDGAEAGKWRNRKDSLAVWSGRKDAVRFDINRCTAADLVSLPGIGPVLAERIIKYRSLLGGFVDKGQLAEVYGLDSSVARMAAERLVITSDQVRPLVLDSASYGDLARHPYIGYEAARKIITYRSVTRLPVTLGAMVSSGAITDELAGRIAPYVRPAPGVTGTDYEFISSKVLK